MEGKDKKNKSLTVAELRKFDGFESMSEKEAESTIATLEKLSILLFELHRKELEKEEKISKDKNGNKDEKRGAA